MVTTFSNNMFDMIYFNLPTTYQEILLSLKQWAQLSMLKKKNTRNTLQSVQKAWKHKESTVFLLSFKNKVNNWIHFFNLEVLYLNRYLKVEGKHIESIFLKNVTKILFNNKFNSWFLIFPAPHRIETGDHWREISSAWRKHSFPRGGNIWSESGKVSRSF